MFFRPPRRALRPADLIPGDELVDEAVRRIGPDELCRRLHAFSVDELRRRLSY